MNAVCGGSFLRRWLAAGMLAVLAGCAASPYAADSKSRSDALLQAQLAQVRQALAPGQPPHVVYAAFALNSASKAFRGDVLRGEQFVRSIDPHPAIVTLANPAFGQSADWPFATPENVAAVLQALGPELRAEDKAVLLFSGHGAPGALALRAGEKDIGWITPAELQQWLSAWGDKPSLIVLSACFSGSFLPALRAPSRIILTAAAANRSSFGCQFNSDGTFFVDALWPDEDVGRFSIRELMARARAGVRSREEALKLTPSQPQAFFSDTVSEWSRQPVGQWLQGSAR